METINNSKQDENASMNAQAFVLINAELGEEDDVVGSLEEMKKKEMGVDEAHIVYGVYDIVAELSRPTKEDLKTLITQEIRKINGVRSTLTMIVVG